MCWRISWLTRQCFWSVSDPKFFSPPLSYFCLVRSLQASFCLFLTISREVFKSGSVSLSLYLIFLSILGFFFFFLFPLWPLQPSYAFPLSSHFKLCPTLSPLPTIRSHPRWETRKTWVSSGGILIKPQSSRLTRTRGNFRALTMKWEIGERKRDQVSHSILSIFDQR